MKNGKWEEMPYVQPFVVTYPPEHESPDTTVLPSLPFIYLKKAPKNTWGSSENLRCSPLTAKAGWDCFIDPLYHLAMQCSCWRRLNKHFRSCFRQIIEK